MSSYIPAELRRLVRERADGLCEYCLVHESDSYFETEVDHIISEKHGGQTIQENLAYACPICNRAKGTDVGSITSPSAQFVRFFNPRTDRWSERFSLQGVNIVPKTQVGQVTARILAFNDPKRLEERGLLQKWGRYPIESARARITRVT